MISHFGKFLGNLCLVIVVFFLALGGVLWIIVSTKQAGKFLQEVGKDIEGI